MTNINESTTQILPLTPRPMGHNVWYFEPLYKYVCIPRYGTTSKFFLMYTPPLNDSMGISVGYISSDLHVCHSGNVSKFDKMLRG